MPPLQLLRVVTVTTALLLCLTWDAMAVPFPSLTFHGSFPAESSTVNPCDPINCKGNIGVFRVGTLPQFGLLGKTLLAAGFSFDVRDTGRSILPVTTFPIVAEVTGNFGILSLQVPADGPAEYVASDTHCNVSSDCTGFVSLGVVDALVLLPGDALYPEFLGQGDVTLSVFGSVSEHGDVFDCSTFPCAKISPVPDFPILLTATLSGSFDVTYRYCTPGIDLGCPDAIPGFNSPVPALATLFLFGSGFAVVLAGAASRRRQS